MSDKELEGLPQVDLLPVLDQLRGDELKKEPKTSEEELDLGQFKNPKDVLRSYKEIQGAFTRVTQENKTLKEKLQEIDTWKEEMEYRRPGSVAAPELHQPQGAKFEDAFVENPEQAIDGRITRQFNVMRITDVLEEEQDKNPEEFQERYTYAQMVSRNPQYQHLSDTPGGVRRLFKVADKMRVENLRKSASKALESIFGEPLGDEEIARLRTLVKGESQQGKPNPSSNAYMPDGTTSDRTGLTSDKTKDYSSKKAEAAEKGDADGVIKAIFEEALSK